MILGFSKIIPVTVSKTGTVYDRFQSLLTYMENPLKTENKTLVSSFFCSTDTAAEEFAVTVREGVKRHADHSGTGLCGYQIIQPFEPGEVSPKEANKVGYEAALKYLKGKTAFLVATHVDKLSGKIHNHIAFPSVTFTGFLPSLSYESAIEKWVEVSNEIRHAHHLLENDTVPGFLLDPETVFEKDFESPYAGNLCDWFLTDREKRPDFWEKKGREKHFANALRFLENRKIGSKEELSDYILEKTLLYDSLCKELKQKLSEKESLQSLSKKERNSEEENLSKEITLLRRNKYNLHNEIYKAKKYETTLKEFELCTEKSKSQHKAKENEL